MNNKLEGAIHPFHVARNQHSSLWSILSSFVRWKTQINFPPNNIDDCEQIIYRCRARCMVRLQVNKSQDDFIAIFHSISGCNMQSLYDLTLHLQCIIGIRTTFNYPWQSWPMRSPWDTIKIREYVNNIKDLTIQLYKWRFRRKKSQLRREIMTEQINDTHQSFLPL